MSAMKTARQKVLFITAAPISVENEIVVARTDLRLAKAYAERTSAPFD